MRFLPPLRAALLLSLGVLLAACTLSSPPVTKKGVAITSGAADLPRTLLVLPAAVRVHEVSAGGVVEEVADWSARAKGALEASLSEYFAADNRGRLVKMPELTAAEEKLLHEYLLLYEVVAGSAYLTTSFPAYGWAHKLENFDYTLGPGLSFLREKTGAEAALFLIGADFISTKGRVAMLTMATLVGAAMPVGSSHLQAGVVDLQTGDILWFKVNRAIGNRDLRQLEDARLMITDMFTGYRP